MPECCAIYRIVNCTSGKVYVGQTWQRLARRFRAHKRRRDCVKLANAMRKYGVENFAIELLGATGSQATADYLEVYFISVYDAIASGYNMREGGSHGRPGAETRAKQSAARKGKKPSPEALEARSKALRGRKHSPEHVAKLAALSRLRRGHRGASPSAEHRKAISESAKRRAGNGVSVACRAAQLAEVRARPPKLTDAHVLLASIWMARGMSLRGAARCMGVHHRGLASAMCRVRRDV
jgi:group I intron endonuclease